VGVGSTKKLQKYLKKQKLPNTKHYILFCLKNLANIQLQSNFLDKADWTNFQSKSRFFTRCISNCEIHNWQIDHFSCFEFEDRFVPLVASRRASIFNLSWLEFHGRVGVKQLTIHSFKFHCLLVVVSRSILPCNRVLTMVCDSLVSGLAQVAQESQLRFSSVVAHSCKFKVFTEPFLGSSSHFLSPWCFWNHHFRCWSNTSSNYSFSDVAVYFDLVALASHVRIDPVESTLVSWLICKQVSACASWVIFTSIWLF